jgi:hypothetical protein
VLVQAITSVDDSVAPDASCTAQGPTLVVDLLGSLGAAYAAEFASAQRPFITTDGRYESLATAIAGAPSIERLVLILPAERSPVFVAILDLCASIAADNPRCRTCLVGSFRAHFGDAAYQRMEDDAVKSFRAAANGVVVLRAGNVRAAASPRSLQRRLLAPLYPLLTLRFRSCFLSRHELFEAIEDLLRRPLAKSRTVTLLGENRPLRDVAAESVVPGPYSAGVSMFARMLGTLFIGQLVGFVFALLALCFTSLRRFQCDTLEPTTVDELLCLYNPYNRRHVALAGYNTGVTHFGWKYRGRTVVKTIGCGRRVRVRDRLVVVDAGVTIKRVVGELNRVDRQLYVVPNYSYVSLGTAFFVPIHGSASDVSTLGETIERVLIYDPAIDRIVSIARGEPAFERYMYDPQSGILVLRLTLRIRSQLRYFKQTTELNSPTAAEVWQLFANPTAANVELRKSRATESSVQVSKYYTLPTGSESTVDDRALEIPRDSIGRIWDRLEENPLASVLFHGFVRRFGFHVELFLDAEEFHIFWEAHTSLPLSKIQLRFVRRDGITHSPFGRRDCISADLFMRRSKSPAFLSFMKEKLPHARFNPGKHSM